MGFAKEKDSSLKDHVTNRSANANALETIVLVFVSNALRELSSMPSSMSATSHGTFLPVRNKILTRVCQQIPSQKVCPTQPQPQRCIPHLQPQLQPLQLQVPQQQHRSRS